MPFTVWLSEIQHLSWWIDLSKHNILSVQLFATEVDEVLFIPQNSWYSGSWASYQIRKIVGCAWPGNAGKCFPRHRLQRKRLISDPGVHHCTCVTHVPWCMSGSLARGGGENVPGIPGAHATRNCTYLARGQWPANSRSQYTSIYNNDPKYSDYWHNYLRVISKYSVFSTRKVLIKHEIMIFWNGVSILSMLLCWQISVLVPL